MRREQLYLIASVALDYPSQGQRSRLRGLMCSVDDEQLRRALEAMIEDEGAEVKYVSLFDLSAERALYVTYHFYGDTRARGQALVELRDLFREAGVDLGGELPDYLPKVLELASRRPDLGMPILERYRAALEKIRRGCIGTPYAELLRGILATLPPVDEGDVRGITNPPEEGVGLDAL